MPNPKIPRTYNKNTKARICKGCHEIIFPGANIHKAPPRNVYHEECWKLRVRTFPKCTSLMNLLLKTGPLFTEEIKVFGIAVPSKVYKRLRKRGYNIVRASWHEGHKRNQKKRRQRPTQFTIYFLESQKNEATERVLQLGYSTDSKVVRLIAGGCKIWS